MNSTHEFDIDWPLLPQRARGGHIIPSLSQHSLLSVVKLCESGCKVTFQHNFCVVHYKGKIMLYRQKCPITKLWLVPLHQQKQLRLINNNNHLSTTQQINNIQQTKNQEQLIQYLHQCLFSPTKSMLIKAVKNNQLLGFPGLTTQAIIKHLP